MVSVVIHTNLNLPNQVNCANWLKSGFDAQGVTCHVTGDKHAEADVHVVQGPWYCYNDWLGQDNVLWLNRCHYGCPDTVVTLGWLRSDGSRDFRNQGMAFAKGALPELKPKKERQSRAVVFGDYGRDPSDLIEWARGECDAVFFRPHPQDKRSTKLLAPDWDMATTLEHCDIAAGHSTTALIEAELAGLHTYSTDPNHPVQNITDREQWLIDLSWTQWSAEEMKRGDFWEHLH